MESRTMMTSSNDTIASISTAVSESGIGVIRLSGPQAISISDQIYRTKNGKRALSSFADHTIHYGFIHDPATREMIDEVLVSVMFAPHTYTAEDTVEINCHGGVYAMKRVLEAVLLAGARMAEPGEFTKRAFLNGRIDLSRAEAVMDVIRSKNEYALQNSLKQLRGALYQKISDLRANMLHALATIESALDDPEHYSLDGFSGHLEQDLNGWQDLLLSCVKSFENGRLLQEGIRTVILGKPNAGKSSLLNMLTGDETAIVTEMEGTTRDILTETVRLGSLTLLLSDTAGIRESDNTVEKIGIERALMAASQADLVLYVADASTSLDDNDRKILSRIQDKQVIYLLNKSDLPVVSSAEDLAEFVQAPDAFGDALQGRVVSISALRHQGLETLQQVIEKVFYQGTVGENNEVVVTSLRQKSLMEDALESLSRVKESIALGMPEDFFSIDLTDACRFLGQITGEDTSEDLVNQIFADFCMGK